MKKGFLISIAYYVIGVLLTILSFYSFDHTYAHGPSMYHMVAFFTYLGGIGWLLVAAIRFVSIDRSKVLMGIIITNLLVSLGSYLYFFWLL